MGWYYLAKKIDFRGNFGKIMGWFALGLKMVWERWNGFGIDSKVYHVGEKNR